MDLHTNDSSESAAGVFVSDKCQIPVGGIPQQEPDRQQYYMALCRQKVQEISDKLGRPLTCFISTFGCQMNAHDSEKLLGILLEAGFVEGTSEESDFVLYNTCTVRENANLRVYGRLGYLHSLKKKNPHMMIALCGCMMQEPEVVEKLKKSYRFVDLIFGTHNVYKLAELAKSRFTFDFMLSPTPFYSLTPTASSSSDAGLFMIWMSNGSTWMPTFSPTGNISVL